MINVSKRCKLTTVEHELFQIIEKYTDDIHYQININAIKQFFDTRLSSPSFNINCSDESRGKTLLMNVSCITLEGESVYERDVMEVILILLDNGADLNMEDYYGWTALEFACSCSSYTVVKLLLIHGANMELRDSENHKSLLLAAYNQKYEIMEVLIEYGGDVNMKSAIDDSPIHVLVRDSPRWKSVPHCFKLLLEYGADVNVQNKMGLTPLTMIIIFRWKDTDVSLYVLRLLLDAYADMNIQFNNISTSFQNKIIPGDTALHIGVRIGTIKLVTMLLEYHPNLSIINQDNDTVLDIAMKRRSNDIVELITKKFRNQMYKYHLYRWLPLQIPTSPEHK